jgi:tetratricopeptide (TPR) repeat protein
MNQQRLDGLASGELVRLGMEAGARGDAEAAIAYLQAATARQDAGAIAHFLLGAEYAQAGMIGRATDEMEAALALDPAFALARLQLGLLLLTNADAVRAAHVLESLDELADGDALRDFGAGLRHLMRDEFAQAEASLRRGLERNTANPALNANMQLILERLPAPQRGEPPADETDDSGWRHMLISTYTGHGPH